MSIGQEIANTTIAQLGGTSRLSAMIGAKDFLSDVDGSVTFKFKLCKKYNAVQISLAANDTYTLEFCKIKLGRNYSVDRAEPICLVYADALRATFERETGLRLSL